MSLLWRREAGRAVVRNDWQLMLVREISKQLLAAGHQWPNDSKVARINRVVCLHCAKASVVEEAHNERLSQVIQVLAHGDHVVLLSPCTVVDHSALHSRAERANGVLLHAVTSPFDDCVSLEVERHPNRLHVGNEWLWLVFGDHRINCDGSNVELDWCN